MKINILGIVKGVAELAVSAGVGVVVGNLVKATTPFDSGRIHKITVAVGGYALGGVLGDLSAKYISSQIDGYAERVNEIIHPSEDVKEAVEDAKAAVAEAVEAVAEATETVVDSRKGLVHKIKELKAQGLTNAEIAKELDIKESQVENLPPQPGK